MSPTAIDQARQLAETVGIDARFICSDLYQFGETSREQYDIVFTSYGVLCWLPDLDRWAATIASSLKPGGLFYLAEFHPVYDVFAGYSYFHQSEPDVIEEGTYTENDTGEKQTLATWGHPISDVVNALIKAGMHITQLNEYPYSPYNCFDGLIEREPGQFYFLHQEQPTPLLYTIKGVKHSV